MVYQVEFTEFARDDLTEVAEYIGRDDPERAITFCAELADKTLPLAQFPELGRPVPRLRRAGARELVFRSYRILYTVNHDVRSVTVHRFWHAARGEPNLTENR